jgi:hypothetical protein
MGNRKLAKVILVSVVGLVMVLDAGYALLRNAGTSGSPECISEGLMTIPDLAGVRVEVIYTNCDTLAKDEAVKVYFSRADVKGESWFARWRSHRTLVFWYDPGGRAFPDMPLPSITHPAPSTILISIPEVSSDAYKSRKWQNMSINYAIGKVY